LGNALNGNYFRTPCEKIQPVENLKVDIIKEISGISSRKSEE
jgi:hypothetical protein